MATAFTCFMLFVFASHHTWAAEGKDNGKFKWVIRGEPFTIQCSTPSSTPGIDYDGVYLIWGLHQEKEVFFFYSTTNKLTVKDKYRGRLETQVKSNNLSITIYNTTEDDSGVYWCMYRYNVGNTGRMEKKEGGGSSLVVVNGKPCTTANETALTPTLVMVTGISAASVLLLCVTVLFIWLAPRIKKLSARKRHVLARRTDSVYEDMRKNNAGHRGQAAHTANHFP